MLPLTLSLLACGAGAAIPEPPSRKDDGAREGNKLGEDNRSGNSAGFRGINARAVIRFRHAQPLTAVAFSPDGKNLVTAGEETAVRLWDRASGNEVRQLGNHVRGVGALAISPDGKILASSDYGGAIRLIEVNTARELCQIRGHDRWAKAIAFSPDGKVLASGGEDGKVCFWDVPTGKGRGVFLGHESWVNAIAFSPDGMLLATASQDKTARLWDRASDTVIWQVPATDPIDCLTFSPDGRTLALTGYYHQEIQVRETVTGQVRCRISGDGVKGPLTVAFSLEGRRLASAGSDGVVHLWDIATGHEIESFKAHGRVICRVVFSPDGRSLASASHDKTAAVWQLSSRQRNVGRAPAALTISELTELWDDLAGGDATKAHRAIWKMAGLAGQAVPFLKERLRGAVASTEDAKRVARLITDLDSDQFQIRERATRDLERLGKVTRPALQHALAAATSPETRRRLTALLEKSAGPLSVTPEELRALRSVELLEQLGTPDARQLLDRLAGGVPEARLTREAKASLRRLTRNPMTSD
jgi:hypothetical protein